MNFGHLPNPCTPDDLLVMHDSQRFELLQGTLVERRAGMRCAAISTRIATALGQFLREHPIGEVFGSRASYACFPRPDHVRRPNVSFIRFDRLPDGTLPDDHSLIAPDLCVEVASPDTSAEAVLAKVVDFQFAGVPLIWVVYPGTRRVLVHRLRESAEDRTAELTETDSISGEDVLPGFECPVAEIFRTPAPPK